MITTTSTSGVEQTKLLSVYQPDSPDVLVYQERNDYRDDGFGDVLVRQTIGTNGVSLTNTWEYYTNSSETYRFGRLKSLAQWTGFWESYNYDDQGRETNRTTGYLNATNGTAGNLCRVVTTSYSNAAPNITRIEKLLDQEIARTYTAFYSASNAVKTVKCTVPGASFSDPGNLISTTTRDAYNRTSGIYEQDFTTAFYTYVTNADFSLTTTMTHGQTNGAGTAILEGTKTITVVGAYGEMVSNIVISITGGVDDILLERDSYSYGTDDYARLSPTVAHLDGTTTSGSSGCCGSPNLGNAVDRDGTTTYYVYDALKRRVSATVNNITSSNIFDAYGNTLVTMRIGTDASVITNRIAAYDTAGRVIAETNALNSPTLYTNYVDGSGQLIKQTTYADAGTRIETYYRDGKLQSVTGSAIAPVRYAYGVVSDGGVQRAYSADIKLDASFADTSERTTNFVDMVGRSYKTAYAAESGVPFAISYFNTKGQLTNQVDLDGVSTLYQYSAKGEQEYSAVDVNTNGTIDFGGTDRITQMVSDVVTNSGLGAAVLRTRTFVWSTNSVNTSNLVAMTETSADGLKTWSTIWNGGSAVTNQSRIVYDAANGYRYTTNISANSAYSVGIFRYGTNVSQTAFDSTGAQLAQTTYSYDTHGRRDRTTDACTGTTTNWFNSADDVIAVATPLPGAGQSSQVTSNYFDSMGRVLKTTWPDGTSVTNEYYFSGLVKKAYGSRAYPVEYTYDSQGRMKTMKTWKDFAGNSGTAITTWSYDAYRGWFTSKSYDGGGAGVTNTYTSAGRLQARTSARGVTTTYSYNNAGNQTGVDYSDSTTDVSYGYDRRGRQISATNSPTVCLLTYDDAGNLVSESYSGGPLNGLTVTNVYDSLLRRTTNGLWNGSAWLTQTRYTYDAGSRLKTVSADTNSATYAYLANSPLVSQTAFTNGNALRMTTTKEYDNLNRLLSITNQPTGSATIGYRYAYNAANQRTSVTNTDTARWVYQYDSLGQVTSGRKHWSDGTPVAGQQFEYTFDDIGNRKTMAAGGDQFGVNLRSAGYTNNALNQIIARTVPGYVDVQGSATNTATVTVNNQSTYRFGDYFRIELSAANTSPLWFGVTNIAVLNNGTNADIIASTTGFVFVAQSPEAFNYDSDGNLVSDSLWTNTWNAENRLVRTESSTSVPSAGRVRADWTYLTDGRWAERIVSVWNGSTFVTQSTNRFVWDGRALLAVLNHTNGVFQSIVRGLDDASLMVCDSTTIVAQPSTHFICHDGNANVAGLVNATNGVESARYDYSPFGETLRASGPMAKANQVRFSSEWADDVTGDVKYLYRIYRPRIGWWLSRDPLGEEAGVSLNCFVQNDAVNHVDRFGLFKESDVGSRLIYSCNCGWLDSQHLSMGGYYKLINDALDQYERDRSKNIVNIPGRNGSGVPSTTFSGLYLLTYKGMTSDKYRLELELGIFMDYQRRFETHQGDFGAGDTFSRSFFSVEDLSSDFLGFLQAAGKIDVKKLCNPLNPQDSRRMVDYGNGPRENKKHNPAIWTYTGTKKVMSGNGNSVAINDVSDPQKACAPCQGKDQKEPSVFSDYRTTLDAQKVKFLESNVTHGYFPGSW